MRERVKPHLERTLRTPTKPQAEVLAQERLTGRDLDEDQSEWRHTLFAESGRKHILWILKCENAIRIHPSQCNFIWCSGNQSVPVCVRSSASSALILRCDGRPGGFCDGFDEGKYTSISAETDRLFGQRSCPQAVRRWRSGRYERPVDIGEPDFITRITHDSPSTGT
jgi:hypothetical protein